MIPAEHYYIVIKNERTLVVSLNFDRVKQGEKKNMINIGEFYYKGVPKVFIINTNYLY